jgi:hypothetical protein
MGAEAERLAAEERDRPAVLVLTVMSYTGTSARMLLVPSAVSTSPALPGARNSIVAPWATVTWLWLLQA